MLELLLWRADDFLASPSPNQIALTVVVIALAMTVLEKVFICMYAAAGRTTGHPILAPRASRAMLARRTLEVCAMSTLAVLGLQAHWRLGGLPSGVREGQAAVERAFEFHPLSCRLALFQLGYQVFNTYMSTRDRDGPIFIGHHIATGMLCFFALAPFLHVYAPFFLGITEVSTAVLCALAAFDKVPMGVPGMGVTFPVTTQVLGVTFALLFVGIRIVIWPWLSYVFWLDVFAVLEAQVHPPIACYSFLVANAGLSLLQVMWLGEIITTAVAVFGKSKDSSKAH
ncbi:TLC domain-containing protein [Pavlovales sp. CCMP2436]|nr:TLC domain-containing protein [Pavlovales sp. CCMP2436]